MKIILILFLVSAATVYFVALRGSFLSRLIAPIVSLAALLFILDPESSNAVAHWFGIGRGLDVFVLITIPMLVLVVLVLLRKYLDLERSLTQLVRNIAIERRESMGVDQVSPIVREAGEFQAQHEAVLVGHSLAKEALSSGHGPRLPHAKVAWFVVFAATIISFFMTLQHVGIYDYFDGIRYLANGISLLHDGQGSPLPAAYDPASLSTGIIAEKQLSYPSLIFQIWSGLTAGSPHPSLLWVGMSGCLLFMLHNAFFFMLAQKFLPLVAAVVVVVFLCFNPLDNLFPRVMARPLPDSLLAMGSTISVYLMIRGRSGVAGLAAGIGSLCRFQGILFLWTNILLAKNLRRAFVYLAVWIACFVLGSVLLNMVFAGEANAPTGGNSGFYTHFFQNQSWATVAFNFAADFRKTMAVLFATREYPLYVLATPFIIVGIWLSSDRVERQFLIFSAGTAHVTSFISFHAMTVAVGTGYADRYLVYPAPLVLLALAISLRHLATRFYVRHDLVTATFLIAAIFAGVSGVLRIRHQEPFWRETFLPDAKLATIPESAAIGLAAAEEAGFEVYAATRSRKLMWLPEDPATFTASDNSKLDYLLVGGFWDRGADTPWIRLAKRLAPIIDDHGTRFEYRSATDYYWVYKRQTDSQ